MILVGLDWSRTELANQYYYAGGDGHCGDAYPDHDPTVQFLFHFLTVRFWWYGISDIKLALFLKAYGNRLIVDGGSI